jgi:hypothetical protein
MRWMKRMDAVSWMQERTMVRAIISETCKTPGGETILGLGELSKGIQQVKLQP